MNVFLYKYRFGKTGIWYKYLYYKSVEVFLVFLTYSIIVDRWFSLFLMDSNNF